MSEWHRLQRGSDEDDLDKAIRHSLLSKSPRAKPPEEVWDRIRQQIEAGPAPSHRRSAARRFRLVLAPMLQGLAAMALLLVGFGFASRLWMQGYQYGTRAEVTQQAVEPTTVVVEERSILAVSQPAPALKLPNDDMLNQGAVLRTLHQQELALRVMAETSDPRRDPSLARRHESRITANQVAVSNFVWDLVSPNTRVLYASN